MARLLESIFGLGQAKWLRAHLTVLRSSSGLMVIADNSDLRAVASEVADKMRAMRRTRRSPEPSATARHGEPNRLLKAATSNGIFGGAKIAQISQIV